MRRVRWIRLAFVDVLGIQKSVYIPASELEAAFDGKVTFDGGSIDGFVRGEEIDMVLRPDPATFTVLPWVEEGQVEARILCDIAMPDGTAFEGCSRTTLKRVLEDALERRARAALERGAVRHRDVAQDACFDLALLDPRQHGERRRIGTQHHVDLFAAHEPVDRAAVERHLAVERRLELARRDVDALLNPQHVDEREPDPAHPSHLSPQ